MKRVDRLVDEHHTLSVERQVDEFLPFVFPLLPQLSEEADATWWLLDSGASTTVLAESSVYVFRPTMKGGSALDLDSFRAANGSRVSMSGQADLDMYLLLADSCGNQKWKQAHMKVMVGQIRHNVLSVTALAHSGWQFCQGPDGFELSVPSAGLHAVETGYFANCPWVRLHPSAVQGFVGNPDFNTCEGSECQLGGTSQARSHTSSSRMFGMRKGSFSFSASPSTGETG